MPDLRDDATEDGFHEIQLSRKQLFFLFMMASVALIFVFLVGVVVGRDTASKATEVAISSPDTDRPIDMADPGPPASTEMIPPAGQTPEELTYHKALSGGASTPEAVKEPPIPPEPTAEKPPPPAPVVPAPSAAPTPDDPALKVATAGRPGTWVIQVAALRTERAAVEQVRDLVKKGYPAFLENPARGLYRVRVGRFKDRGDADRMAKRLEKEGLKSVISR